MTDLRRVLWIGAADPDMTAGIRAQRINHRRHARLQLDGIAAFTVALIRCHREENNLAVRPLTVVAFRMGKTGDRVAVECKQPAALGQIAK